MKINLNPLISDGTERLPLGDTLSLQDYPIGYKPVCVEKIMPNQFILPFDSQNATLDRVGGKGSSLTRMVLAGLPIPGGFHITTEAYHLFVMENDLQMLILKALEQASLIKSETLETASQEITKAFQEAEIPVDVINAIVKAYALLPGATPSVAVRSSATAEDLPEASFAGQQETFLNVCRADEIIEAVRNCWASLWTARAISYRLRQGIETEGVDLAVVVQLMVNAESAGILFTANPLNGRRDQMLLNASWGLGEAVVGGLVTPDTLTLDKTSGHIITRETANKLIRTAWMEKGTQELPVPKNLQLAPVLSDHQAMVLARLGNQVEAFYGMPMDIEWAFANGEFAILQARPITALPETGFPTPTEWNLPKGAYAAMRNNIVELMADPLTPLFKTLGLTAVNTSLTRLMKGFLGDLDLLPSAPIIAVNEYAYYNGSVRFGPILKVILDTWGILRRMFTGAVERWTEEGRPRYLEIVQRWEAQPWQEYPATQILQGVRQLAEAAIDAYGSLVSGVIPAAWMSEAWFTWQYRFLKGKSDPKAPVYLMGFDSLPIKGEKSLYDLAQWAISNPPLAAYLLNTPSTQLAQQLENKLAPEQADVADWDTWQKRFKKHLQDYGHMIYNLDFGNPIPADDPEPVIETLKLFLNEQGVNPYERQKTTAERRQHAVDAMLARLKGWRMRSFQKNLVRAQKYAPLREDGLADVGLGYPLLRQMLLELGSRFVKGGMIGQEMDVFWLIEEEVEEASERLDRFEALDDLSKVIPQRKAIWQAARRAVPPLALPQMKVFGVDLMALKSGLRKDKGETLKGVGASPGVVTAPACVLHGPEDFGKMNTGDVLVASLTTPAWTPLFARAAAVVTDIGGPLSHGSIVAREYGIPAVLGTGSATARISSGQTITVDGNNGKVFLSANGHPK